MDISAPMLFHHMKRYFSVDYVYYGYENLVRTPLFYSTFFETDRHIVLVRASELCECLEKTRHSVVICLDTVKNPQSLDLNTNDLIVLNDSLAENMALNILNHILESYNLWENNMNDILHNRHSFLDIVNSVSDQIELPCALTDSNFRYIAYSDNSTELMDMVDQQNQLPIEIAKLLTADPNFKKLEELTDCFLYKSTQIALHKNIFNKGVYVGRIAAMLPDTDYLRNLYDHSPEKFKPKFRECFGWEESMEELLDYYKAIFHVAGRFIEILYAQAESFENSAAQFQQIHMYLSKIYNREYANARELGILLEEQGARPGDRYRIGVMMMHDAGTSFYSPTYLCAQIEHHLPGSYAVWNAGKIVVLCNLSSSRRKLAEGFEERAVNLVRQLQVYCSYSRAFFEVDSSTAIHTAFEQADFALTQGMRQKTPQSRSYWDFDDCALEYILTHGVTGLTAEMICHPALLNLRDHDQAQGTHFLETLQAFVRSGYNAAATARQLYIHRSSFLGRMDRIRELVKLDFDDADERLYLEISLRVFF